MISILAFLLLVSGAIGAGSMAVQLSGIRTNFTFLEDIAISSVLGFGLIGWLAFFPGLFGHFSHSVLLIVAVLPSIGLIPLWLRRPTKDQTIQISSFSWIETISIFGLLIAFGFDVFEAFSPQADGDTMAYHFATPTLFLKSSTIEFIPRALDGAVPLLQQLGYGVALAIGGELTANLWLLASGWALGLITYAVTRHIAPRSWALLITLLIMTMPAIVYGAGTGQVEARAASFVIVAGFTVYIAIREDLVGAAFIAAVAVGLFFGTKYTGLVLGFACGIAFLSQGRAGLRHAIVFSLVAIFIGSQWYAFNFYHTGDPIFPLLWGIVEYPLNFPWSDEQSHRVRELYAVSETPVSKNIIWFLIYPFVATLDPYPQFEASRVGLGIVWLLLLPLSAIGLWRYRRSVTKSPAFIFILICLVYYSVWFFFGPSQRVRHLLPVYPLLVIALAFLGLRALREWPALVLPYAVSLIAVIFIQLGGHALFSIKFIRFIVTEQASIDFLQRNIVGYDVVRSLNTKLGNNDRVLVTYRPWLYRINVPYFYAHPDLQSEVILRPKRSNPSLFLRQTRTKAITHVVTKPDVNDASLDPLLQKFMINLEAKSCARVIEKLEVPSWPSRTLELKPPRIQPFLIYEMTPLTCQIQ